MARKLAFDRILFAAVLLLTGLGLVMVYSSTAVLAQKQGHSGNPLFLKQCVAAVLGIGAMVAIMHVDYRLLRKPVVLYAGLCGVVMMLVAVLFGPEINNARRWFVIAGLSIQPSELAKLVVIPYLAYQIERKRDRLDDYAFLIPAVGVTGLCAALILAGKDLGTATLLCIPACLLVFLAGISLRWMLAGGLLLLPAMALAIFLQPYRMARLTGFLDPEGDPQGNGFQLLQSLIAVGSGGLFGLGPGHSVQKLHFLPSPHADFVFSIVAEELGFFGAMLVVGLFGVLLWRGVVAGRGAPDAFGRYLAWGFTAVLVIQGLMHVSVALGLSPTTGIPLPFISHGGSSLVTSLVAAGVILNVSQHG